MSAPSLQEIVDEASAMDGNVPMLTALLVQRTSALKSSRELVDVLVERIAELEKALRHTVVTASKHQDDDLLSAIGRHLTAVLEGKP